MKPSDLGVQPPKEGWEMGEVGAPPYSPPSTGTLETVLKEVYYFWRLGSGRFIKRILQETYAFWRLGSGGWRLTSGGFVKRILDIEGGRVGRGSVAE